MTMLEGRQEHEEVYLCSEATLSPNAHSSSVSVRFPNPRGRGTAEAVARTDASDQTAEGYLLPYGRVSHRATYHRLFLRPLSLQRV